MLNDKENKKYETIEKVINGFMTRKEASIELKLSLKQIDRLKSIYYSKGKDGFIHGNRGKLNPNKKDENLIKTLEELYLEKHFDFNFEHFYEEHVFGKYDISYDAMLKAFTKDDIISPLAHKNTVKLYKDKMKEVIKEDNSNIKEEKVELFKSRIIETEKAHPRRSNNLYTFGQEVQMDACNKMWFGGIPSFLHLAVDKATKKVLFGWFEYEEITRGYYVLLFNMIINYGIPQKIKADNRSTFSANNAKNKEKKVFMTQFGKVCERLDIVLHTTSVSTAKANVERENKTFKDRLIAELRYEGITDIDEAIELFSKQQEAINNVTPVDLVEGDSWNGGSFAYPSETTYGNGYWNRYYLAVTKHVIFQNIGELGAHLTWIYSTRFDNNLNSPAIGVNFQLKLKGKSLINKLVNGVNLMVEVVPGYTEVNEDLIFNPDSPKYQVNLGMTYSVWKDYINLVGELNRCKYLSAGVFFRVHLK